MRESLHLFTWPKHLFFDTPEHHDPPENVHYDETVQQLVDGGWDVDRKGAWCVVSPADEELPRQGWKIHVSTVPSEASAVLDLTARYCVEQAITFKFVRNSTLLLAYMGKNAPRTSSGKFLCLYPRDEETLSRALHDLDERLSGCQGPFILTDLRWGSGPLFLRYGAFDRSYVYERSGKRVLAMRDSDGRMIPDSRRIPFRPPEWAPLPPEVSAGIDGGSASGEFPFTVTAALQFSNAGGVYRGVYKETGEPIILKEARANTGWDDGVTDSVAWLQQEEQALRALDPVESLPRVVASLHHWEHYFLAISELPGQKLATWRALNNPLFQPQHSAEDLKRYQSDVDAILTECLQALTEIHGHGWAHRDINPANILVDDDLNVSIVDFEMSAPVDTTERPLLGVAGYATAVGDGRSRDLAALEMLKLDMYLPLVSHITLDPGLRPAIVAKATEWFDLPTGYFDASERVAPATGPARWAAESHRARPDLPAGTSALCDLLSTSVIASAEPHRADRLFPGDPAQFTHRWAAGGLAHGAAGVLWALRATGVQPPAHLDDWVRHLVTTDVRDAPPGLWDGAAGITWYLGVHGNHDLAQRALEPIERDLDIMTDPSIQSGLAGIGLMAANLADDPNLGAAMRTLGAHCAERIATDLLSEPELQALPGGLLQGWSGVSLFLTRWYEYTGSDRWLQAAERALHRDLDQCATTENGDLRVDDGRRHLPYLGVGSMGVAVAAAELARYRDDPSLNAAIPRLASGIRSRFTALPGVSAGYSGLVLGAVALGNHLDQTPTTTAFPDMLRLFLCRDANGAHLVGDLGVRASCDFATGTAGALAAMAMLRAPDFAKLPFLGFGSVSTAR